VEKELDRRNYEEFMRVNESDQDLIMLVRTEGRSFKEFLIVAGGEDNVLIQVKGNMTFREAERFSEKIKKDNGAGLVNN
jgi:nicotinate-nucleotide pyrophosphorylase